MKSKKKLVEEYIQKIISKLCYEYRTSLEDARKAVEELDLLNRYKGNYDYLLHEDIIIWVDLIVSKHKKEVEAENMKKKTIVKSQSDKILIYDGTILKPLTKDYVDEKVEKALKEFKSMENYIVINGKKAELTEEQLKALGIEVEKKKNNPFNSELKDEDKCFIINIDEGVKTSFYDSITDKKRLNNANSFNDKDFAYQVYLHELLNRKLLKYAWDNESEDCEWNGNSVYYCITCNKVNHDRYSVIFYSHLKGIGTVYFSNKEVAEQAIKDVIKPFIKEHPDFVW